jgi:uncharacterized protein with GYD domain
MPTFMFRARYTATGAAGLLKEGGTARATVVKALAQSVGGKILSEYWVMGEDDFIAIAEMPDAEAAAALSLTVGASGAVSISTSQLFSASDVDEIAKRHAVYRAPGA